MLIPWNRIFVDPEDNIRKGELPEVEALAARMKDAGQLMPVIVTNGETVPDGYAYRLRAGARRHAAFALLGWKEREMLAIVREHDGADSAARAFRDTWSENHDRAVVPALDEAEAIGKLATGTYGPGGALERPLSKDEIAELLGLSGDTVRLGLRVYEKLHREAKAVLRTEAKTRAPFRRLIAWAALKSGAEQCAAIRKWIKDQKALADAGRQRKPRTKAVPTGAGYSSGDDEGEDRPRGTMSPNKKVGKKAIPLSTHLQAALHAAGLEKDKAEKAYLEGLADGLRFISGDYKGSGLLPKVLKEHYEAVEE